MINEIEKALPDGFETALFRAALKNLADTANLLRFNNFSYSMRELTRHVLHRLAPDEQVLGCSWYRNETQIEKGITRYQRAYFAVQGGLDNEYVKNVLEIEVDEIHQRLIRAIGKLSKYTHIEPSTFDLPAHQADLLANETLDSFASFLTTVAECRKTILERLWEEIDSSVVDEVLKETINDIDKISSHHYIDEVYKHSVIINCIDDKFIYFVADGTIGCQLQWGSNSDVRKGDGAILSESFPFRCNLISPITDPEAVEVVEETLGVDMSSWHGSD